MPARRDGASRAHRKGGDFCAPRALLDHRDKVRDLLPVVARHDKRGPAGHGHGQPHFAHVQASVELRLRGRPALLPRVVEQALGGVLRQGGRAG